MNLTCFFKNLVGSTKQIEYLMIIKENLIKFTKNLIIH